MRRIVMNLEQHLKGYLDDFFKKYDKDYNYSLDVKIEKYLALEEEEIINKIMLPPCEIILYKNKRGITENTIKDLKQNCIDKSIEWNHEEATNVLLCENKCGKIECYKDNIQHIETEKDEMITIKTYRKVAGTKDKFYIISFMVDKSFSKEMLEFYKFYIHKILDMFQFNLDFNFDKNIFIDAREEYKAFLTKSFLSFLIEENFGYKNSYQIIEHLILTFKLNYEKQKTVSRILITEEDCKSYFLKFDEIIDLKEIKKGRKLLELCKNDELCLHLKKDKYIGICKNQGFNNYIEIQIKENQGYIFKLKNKDGEKEFHIKNHNIAFDVKEPQQYFRELKDVLKISKQQTKGTMIIVLQTDDAKKESDRLIHTGIKTKKFRVTEENILNITSIDGALIMDQNFNCYGMGIILDTGDLKKDIDKNEYNPARGARYNSAVRYKEYLKQKDISHYILVVSEDGDIFKFEYYNKDIDNFKKLKEELEELYNKEDNLEVTVRYSKEKELLNRIEKINDKPLLTELGSTYNIIGISFSNLKNTEKSIELYNLALKIKWENKSVYNNLAIEYLADYNPKRDVKIGFDFYKKSIQNSKPYSILGETIVNNIYNDIIREGDSIDVKKWVQDMKELFVLEDLENLKRKLKEGNELDILECLKDSPLIKDGE